jgi:predicted nucleotide-binding protein
VADECNDWVGKVYPEFADVTLFVEQFYEEMDYRTDKLRGVIKRLEDMGEFIPRTITAQPPAAAQAMMEPEPAPAASAPAASAHHAPAPAPTQSPTVTVTFTTPSSPSSPAPAKPAAQPQRSYGAPAPSPVSANSHTKATTTTTTTTITAPHLAPPPTSEVVPPLNTGIFVVHGDLQPTVNTINAFMEDLNIQLQPLPAHPERAKGLVNSLEKNPDASFALVLLGHDDAVALRRSAADASAGVRSGIVFELGYFVGRLGLKRVCVLYTGGTETFVSDHGIQFLPIDSGNGWQLQLARHLKRAGIEIDLNKLF